MASDRGKLVAFLDREVFDPVLRCSETSKSPTAKRQLRDVQDATRAEKERYHHQATAAEVKRRFKDTVHSEPARKLRRVSHQLGLPALDDVEDEFDELCEELGVK